MLVEQLSADERCRLATAYAAFRSDFEAHAPSLIERDPRQAVPRMLVVRFDLARLRAGHGYELGVAHGEARGTVTRPPRWPDVSELEVDDSIVMLRVSLDS